MKDERGFIGILVAVILILALIGLFAVCSGGDDDDVDGMKPIAQVGQLPILPPPVVARPPLETPHPAPAVKAPATKVKPPKVEEDDPFLPPKGSLQRVGAAAALHAQGNAEDIAYSVKLALLLCEAKPWVFCDPRIYTP